MRHMRFLLGLAAPLALLAAPALAQQAIPPAGRAPSGAINTNQTRELENEIEEYPGPSDGLLDDRNTDTRIPEQIQSAPGTTAGTRPNAASPAASSRSSGAPSSAIEPSEVQRVFGTDAGVIALGSLDSTSITQLQGRLHELGHDPGPVDGVMGPKTRAAIEAYARAQFILKQQLLQQDQLTPDLAQQLGVAAGRRPGVEPPMPDRTGPAMRGDAPPMLRGGAPLPPPGIAPLPTPSTAAPRGATPSTPPPSL